MSKSTPLPLPQGQEKVEAVRSMFDAIAPRYELVNRLLTFGLDTRWRKKSLRSIQLQPNSVVLDLACGTGDFCRLLEHEGHTAIGVDLSFGMLANARTSASLIQADVLNMPFANGSVDAVTCGFGLRNFAELQGFFEEVVRVVKPGGRVAFLDAYHPNSRLLKFGHGIYFGKIVPKIGGWITGNKKAYAYLPKSVDYMPEPSTTIKQMESAGFTNINRTVFLGGAAHLFTAQKPD